MSVSREIKEETKADADIDDLLDEENVDEIPIDSIMDVDSDEKDWHWHAVLIWRI